jgi:hypothetical protein
VVTKSDARGMDASTLVSDRAMERKKAEIFNNSAARPGAIHAIKMAVMPAGSTAKPIIGMTSRFEIRTTIETLLK